MPANTPVKTADAIEGSWVYRIAPARLRPWLKLARVDRPVGTWLLLWPCWWALMLGRAGRDAAAHLPDGAASEQAAALLHAGADLAADAGVGASASVGASALGEMLLLFALFAVGALFMRGAGCTYNDILDKDFDAQVTRTKSRPIPSGEVSVKGAWGFLILQALVGLAVLAVLQLYFSSWSAALGVGSLGLVALYPMMKRWTWWPQAWLGLTFNWGALMGYAASNGAVGWPAVVLYAGCLFWTLGYDTIYAHQDREDDALIGVKSTALRLMDKTKPAVAGFYALFVVSLIATGWLANLGGFYYTSVGVAAAHLARQVWLLDMHNPDMCLKIFRSNIGFGWIVFAGLVLDSLLA